MIKSVNRSDIARQVAKELKLTIKQTEDIFVEAEKAILLFLRERERVRLHDFGTFYQTTMKSHVIKQIRTKTPRIVLEQKSIKFKPSPIFKDAIYQRVRKKYVVKKKDEEETKSEHLAKGNVAVKYQPTPPRVKTSITFAPLRRWHRVDKNEIERKIKERLIGIAKTPRSDVPQSNIAREAKIFSRLLWQIRKSGKTSVDFSYEDDKYIKIFAGRPRHQAAKLPREIIKGFLTHLDLEEFDLPQERHKLISTDKAMYDKINIRIHSFPTHSGASIHIDIK